MRLLFDQNLSPALVGTLADIYPGSRHTEDLGGGQKPDLDIWRLAAENDFVVVSEDSDFHARCMVQGPPPKLIWRRTGNCSTAKIADLLRINSALIHTFAEHPTEAFIAIS